MASESSAGGAPFLCLTFNGGVVHLPLGSAKGAGKPVLKELSDDDLQAIGVQNIAVPGKGCSVCITTCIAFPVKADDRDWGVTVKFHTRGGEELEFVLGVANVADTHPTVFTQVLPIQFHEITAVTFKALPHDTKRREKREMLLTLLDEAMTERAKQVVRDEDKQTTMTTNDERVIKVGASDLRVLVENKLQNRFELSSKEWDELLQRQSKYTTEVDAKKDALTDMLSKKGGKLPEADSKKDIVVSEMFSKKKDPCYWADTPKDYERVVILKVLDKLNKHGRVELPLLMDLLWTDDDVELQQATRRVLCPNWKVLKEILYDNKSKFEWKTNYNPPYISLKPPQPAVPHTAQPAHHASHAHAVRNMSPLSGGVVSPSSHNSPASLQAGVPSPMSKQAPQLAQAPIQLPQVQMPVQQVAMPQQHLQAIPMQHLAQLQHMQQLQQLTLQQQHQLQQQLQYPQAFQPAYM